MRPASMLQSALENVDMFCGRHGRWPESDRRFVERALQKLRARDAEAAIDYCSPDALLELVDSEVRYLRALAAVTKPKRGRLKWRPRGVLYVPQPGYQAKVTA